MSLYHDLQIELSTMRPARKNIHIDMNRDTKDIVVKANGNVYSCSIKNQTTEYWNGHANYVPFKNEIIVYSDYIKISDNPLLFAPAMKVGDGKAYVADLPFINVPFSQDLISEIEKFENHMADPTIHVSLDDRERWNKKTEYEVDEGKEELIL